jgi:hypothetical protein
VEAAGIEPFSPTNPNPMVANDFGFYCVKTFELPRRFFSPGVPSSLPWSPPSLGDILETVVAGNVCGICGAALLQLPWWHSSGTLPSIFCEDQRP